MVEDKEILEAEVPTNETSDLTKLNEDTKAPKLNLVKGETDPKTEPKNETVTEPGGESKPKLNLKKDTVEGVTFDNVIDNFDVADYSDILGDSIFMPTGGIEALNKERAMMQSGWQQARNMVGQAVVGEIVGGTLEGLGYLLDLNSIGNYIAGNETEWGNFMTDAGKGMRTWGQENMAIHQVNPGKFDMSDSGWWFSNGVSVASTLSMLLPSMAATKALGFLGKGASKIGGKMSKVLDVAGNMGKKQKWMTEGISQAIVSRHIENSMEASGTFESAHKDYLNKINKKTGLLYSDDEARQLAAKAASENYNKGWAMLLQDIPQYLALGKVFNPSTMKMENALSKAAQKGKSIGLKPWQQKIAGGLGTFASEGFEESYQYYIAEKAKALTDLNAGLITRDRYKEIMSDAMGSEEMMTSAFFGGLGGNVFQAAGSGLNTLLKGKKRRAGEKQWEQSYKAELNDRAKSFAAMQLELSNADQANDAPKREAVLDEMMLQMTVDALHRDKFDEHIESLMGMANMSEEEIKAIKDKDGQELNKDLIDKYTPGIIEKAHEIRADYLKFSNKYDPRFAAKMAANNYRNKRYKEQVGKSEKNLKDIIQNMPSFGKMSTTEMERQEGKLKVQGLVAVQRTLKKRLKTAPDYQKESIQNSIDRLQDRIVHQKTLVNNKGDDPRDARRKKQDAGYAKEYLDIADEFVSEVANAADLESQIAMNVAENLKLKDEGYRQNVKDEDRKEKIENFLKQEDPETANAEPAKADPNKSKTQQEKEAKDKEDKATLEKIDVVKKSIEDDNDLTDQEKERDLAVVAEVERNYGLENEKARTKILREEIAEENRKKAEAASKEPGIINNTNTSKIVDNLEDEHAGLMDTTTAAEEVTNKGQRAVSLKVREQEHVKAFKWTNNPKIASPEWFDWLFNGKDKVGTNVDVVVGYVQGTEATRASQIFDKYKAGKEISKEEKDHMYNFLPIKLQLTETAFSHLPLKFPKKGEKAVVNPKRAQIIDAMAQGDLQMPVTHQFGGNLQVEETEDQSVPTNSVLDLQGVKGDKTKLEFIFSDENGGLKNFDKTDNIELQGTKINVKGERDQNNLPVAYKGGIFLLVRKANGHPFPLKVNIRRPNLSEAEFIADLLLTTATNPGSNKFQQRLDEFPELFKRFKENHPNEFKVLGNDALIGDVAKLFVHMTADTEGKDSHLYLSGNRIHYGTSQPMMINKENMADNRDVLVDFIQRNKRRQVNLNLWNKKEGNIGKKYQDHIIADVISTDAVVDGNLFSEEKTAFRDNGLPPFSWDITFGLPTTENVNANQVPKRKTYDESSAADKKARKDFDRRTGLSAKNGIKKTKDGTFVGVYHKKSGVSQTITGETEKAVGDKINELYRKEMIHLPAKPTNAKVKPNPKPKVDEGGVEIPTLTTVKVDLENKNLEELSNIAKQLRQKAVNARAAEKEGKQILGGSASIQADYDAVKTYIAGIKEAIADIKEAAFGSQEEAAKAAIAASQKKYDETYAKETVSEDIWNNFLKDGKISKIQENNIYKKDAAGDLLSPRESRILEELNKRVKQEHKDVLEAENRMAQKEITLFDQTPEDISAQEAKDINEIKERNTADVNKDPDADVEYEDTDDIDDMLSGCGI